MTPGRRDQRGMTIVELMIAMVILGVVIGAGFSVSFSIMNSFREHRRAIGVERSVRGVMALMSRAVRNASPGVPNGQIVDLVGCETTWQGLRVEDSTTGPDVLDVIYASGGIVTSLRTTLDQDSTAILVQDGSSLKTGDQVLVTDLSQGHLFAVEEVAEADGEWTLSLASAAQELCSPAPAAFSYPVRSLVLRAQKARFSVSDTEVPALMMDPDGEGGEAEPEPLAEGIEDLQIAIGVDRDGDGAIDEVGTSGDDDDWVYNHPDDTLLPDMITTPYRALRLTLTARSSDETTTVATSFRPAAENREAATQGDGVKRRSLSSIIEIRNLRAPP